MDPGKEIEAVPDSGEQIRRLNADLDRARRELREAEANLAEEQAAVNSFRMHCRLKLDAWVEALLDLQTERQSLLTRLQLHRQAQDLGLPYDEEDPFWQSQEFEDGFSKPDADADEQVEELVLPTDTPHDKAAERRLYRQLARKFHPDMGVTAVEIAYRTEMMSAVNLAYESANIQGLYDLAGELDPSEAAEIAAIKSVEIRRLRRHLLQCHRHRNRCQRRLEALRRENTARLWRKAQYLDESGMDWWEIVRREIEQAIERVQNDVERYREEIRPLERSRD